MLRAETVELLPGVTNDRLFNAANEIRRAAEVMRQYLRPHAVLQWVSQQTEGFLAEFGLGESLSIQPSYWFELRDTNGFPGVFPLNIPEYGEQSASYREAPGFPSEIGLGLERAYRLLHEAQTGEGVVIVSPTNFYREYGSRFDVMNLFRVTKDDGAGTRVVEGRYVLLNGALADHERAFVLNWHNPEASVPSNTSPQLVVLSPQRFRYGEAALASRDPIVTHTQELERIFTRRFGKALLGGETDLGLYGVVRAVVASGAERLLRAVLASDAQRLLATLKELLVSSQRTWAGARGIDPDEHLADIFLGRRPIGGIHPITGLPVEDGSGMSLGEEDPCATDVRRCAIHGEYEGGSCPQCRERSV